MTNEARNVAFLFGAGISIPAGLPSTADITKRVLSGEGIYHHTNDTFQNQPNVAFLPEAYVPRVVAFLNILRQVIFDRYSHRPDFQETYEDLFNVVAQVHADIMGEFDNPAVLPLVRALNEQVESMPQETDIVLRDRWDLAELVHYSKNYIKDLTWCELRSRRGECAYLARLAALVKEPAAELYNIFTLNHDLLIEKVLLEQAVHFNFGFSEPDRDQARQWLPDLFDESEPRVRLFKLHGSLNWYRARRGDSSVRYIIPLSEEAYLKPTLRRIDPFSSWAQRTSCSNTLWAYSMISTASIAARFASVIG